MQTFDTVAQHVFLCVEVQWANTIILSDYQIFCFVHQFHTFSLIHCSSDLIKQCIVISVAVFRIVVSAACFPHIDESHRIIVVSDPAVTCDRVITFLTAVDEGYPFLVVQSNRYTKYIFPHKLQSFCNCFVSFTCIIQIFYYREAFSVRISSFCKQFFCFFTICFVICICWCIVISSNCTEVIACCTICVIYTVRYESASFYLSLLCNFFYNVSTVNCQCKCFSYKWIVKWFLFVIEAYEVCSNVIQNLQIARSYQTCDFCLWNVLDEIQFS